MFYNFSFFRLASFFIFGYLTVLFWFSSIANSTLLQFFNIYFDFILVEIQKRKSLVTYFHPFCGHLLFSFGRVTFKTASCSVASYGARLYKFLVPPDLFTTLPIFGWSLRHSGILWFDGHIVNFFLPARAWDYFGRRSTKRAFLVIFWLLKGISMPAFSSISGIRTLG